MVGRPRAALEESMVRTDIEGRFAHRTRPASLVAAVAAAASLAVAPAWAQDDLPVPVAPGVPGHVAEPRAGTSDSGSLPPAARDGGFAADAGSAGRPSEVTGASDPYDADNTARNTRDRDDGAVTPMDQSNAAPDLAITQHIRREVVRNDALSTNAHNVKIVTQDGIVTLRGPVKTAAEKREIAQIAQQAPGVQRVDDRLEVEAED
jgi:hyperosmotically inducible protein